MEDLKHYSVIKASGEKAEYVPQKLAASLKKAGADDYTIDKIAAKIRTRLYNGISTREIYHHAFNMLKKERAAFAAKYKLKRAIMELGPSGFPFERYFAEILNRQGYNTSVGKVVQGRCVSHEIDIIAEKNGKYNMLECKFHHHRGVACDVKIPLYIQSRFKDVEDQSKNEIKKFDKAWVVTNTKFTADAIRYANCIGLQLVGWDYPEGKSLKVQIDRLHLYPLTCLTTITASEKNQLLKKDIALCKDLLNRKTLLSDIGIAKERIENILQEASELCVNLELSK